MIEEGLYSYLSGKAAISALVSTRVYPMLVPQGATYPAISYQKISGNHVRALSGSTAGLANPRIQINCWARTYSAAKSLAEQVRLAMDGYAGSMGSESVNACFLMDERDQFEPSPGNEADRLYCTQLDFEVWHGETVPTL